MWDRPRAGVSACVLGAALGLLAACGGAGTGGPLAVAGADGAASPLDAVAPIAPADLPRLLAMVRPQEGEERFLEIPWRLRLWDARRQAAEEGRPILAFLMSGHPLGCT